MIVMLAKYENSGLRTAAVDKLSLTNLAREMHLDLSALSSSHSFSIETA